MRVNLVCSHFTDLDITRAIIKGNGIGSALHTNSNITQINSMKYFARDAEDVPADVRLELTSQPLQVKLLILSEAKYLYLNNSEILLPRWRSLSE